MDRRDRMNRLHNKFNLAFSIAFIYYIEFHVKYWIEEIYGDRISQVNNLFWKSRVLIGRNVSNVIGEFLKG